MTATHVILALAVALGLSLAAVIVLVDRLLDARERAEDATRYAARLHWRQRNGGDT